MIMKNGITVIWAAVIFIGCVVYHLLFSIGGTARIGCTNNDLQIEWPAFGQAAVGSMANGVLASSLTNEKVRPIASMAKVVTALAVLEKQPVEPGQDGQSYIMTVKDISNMKAHISQGGSVLPIFIGMKMTQHQAMQRMLTASDNTAADILIERVFGSEKSYLLFAGKMLKRMGLNRTHIADASGLNPATVSTPSELIVIGIAALKNPVIAGIVSRQHTKVPVAGLIKNTNELLGTMGVIGIKTGTTRAAGSCLLFAARYTNRKGNQDTLIAVIMGEKSHVNLYKYSKDLLVSAKKGVNRVHDLSTIKQSIGKGR
jgi:D-alanyl-D-alanine carboxypeptidase (penicillin-binding protein 5/6)